MSIITLTTDYGLKDHFVGALKGKLLSEFPEASIIDISHHIDAFNIAEAAYIIGAAYGSFPKGTVHLIGVDIELNTENQHIAMQWNDQYFVCADNGILSMLIQKIVPQKLVTINIHDRLPSDATDLDVFVKVACHLAKGGLLNVIGKEISAIKEVTELQAVVQDNQIKGYVIYIDHLGNAVTNISKKLFLEMGKSRPYEIKFKGQSIKTILPKFSDIVVSEKYSWKDYEGEKLAIFNEAGFLEIAIFRSNPDTVGSANSLLGLTYRDLVTIDFKN
ncbi:S-adenosyl-l-methionine hydroxide adenosyltransferase family protein [Flavobacterium sp.]|uniref:SAM hydrolase/SAM-dependent halogenase family protein n=1 Tax=Flavobacterium sp. TaxID=239 RepID=UPI00391D4A38